MGKVIDLNKYKDKRAKEQAAVEPVLPLKYSWYFERFPEDHITDILVDIKPHKLHNPEYVEALRDDSLRLLLMLCEDEPSLILEAVDSLLTYCNGLLKQDLEDEDAD